MFGLDDRQQKMLKRHAGAVLSSLRRAKRILDEKHEMAGQLHKIIPPARRENVLIEHLEVDEKQREVMFENLAAAINGRPDRVCPSGTYTRLGVKIEGKWEIMMTDAPYELRSAEPLMATAHGQVLIAGLGLGASLIPVVRKKGVGNVVVIEKNQDVIDLVLPHIRKVLDDEQNDKLVVFHEDAFTWKPPKAEFGPPYDVIWLDIWPRITEENLPEITKLKRRYVHWLNRKNHNRWIGAWEEKFLRRQASASRRIQRLILGTVGGDVSKGFPKCRNPEELYVITGDKELKL